MCAIVDANVAHQVFGPDRPEAGIEFFKWIASGKGRLVAGGKLLKELSGNAKFKLWWREAQLAGRTKAVNNAEVDKQTRKVERSGGYRSDDPHVLALAQISGARLLFTNDQDLQQDFKDSKLIGPPGGKIYTTRERWAFGNAHKNLLRQGNPCP